MPYVKNKDNKIYYKHKKVNGSYTVILLHAWLLNHTSLDKQAKYLQKKGCSTVQIDLRGHGKSACPKDKSEYKISKFVEDLKLVVDELKLDKFILLGHSLGGMIAIEYVGNYQEKVSNLILIDTNFKKPMADVDYKNLKNHVAEHLQKGIVNFRQIKNDKYKTINFSKFKTKNDFFYWLLATKNASPHTVSALLQTFYFLDEEASINKIKIPTLIIEGEKDFLTPINVAKKMHAMIPNSKLEIIQGGTHYVPWQESFNVNKTIEKFLQENFI